ncbi:MAG: hypothetical protein JJU11_08845 [Candidatus Sumerlaeia bacterium]|nr:hypothetical protein [Candidatus Sumerlaeia bacterium]
MTILSVVFVAIALALWLRFSWAIVDVDPPPHLLGGFPLGGLLALGIVVLATIFHGALGWFAAGGSFRLNHVTAGGMVVVALCILVGEALLSILAGWLGFLLLFPGLPAAITMIVVGLLLLFSRIRPINPAGLVGKRPPLEFLPLLLVGLLVFVAAMAPLAHSDGLRYHIPAPMEWLRAGRFVNLPYNANSNLPSMQGLLAASWSGQALLLQVFQIFGAVHYLILVILAGSLGVACLRSLPGRSGGEGSRLRLEWGAFATAGLMAGSIPLLALLAAWPFSDVMAVTFLLGGIRCIVPGLIRTTIWRVGLGSLLIGAAAATKLSLLPLCVFVGGFAFLLGAVSSARGNRPPHHLAMAVLIPGLLIIGPWMIKSTVYHGNPVYPVAWGIFGGQEWNEENDALYRHQASMKGVGTDPAMFLQTPWLVTRYWASFESFNPGPHFLAFLPISLVGVLLASMMRGRWRRLLGFPTSFALLLLLLGGWVVWFFTYQSTRFLLPCILLAVIIGVGLIYRAAMALPPNWVPGLRIALGIIAVIPLAWAPSYNLRTEHSIRAGLGFVGPEIYLSRPPSVFNAFPAVQWLNENTDRNEPVFYIGEHRRGHARNFQPIASDWFDTPMILVEIRRTADIGTLYESWRQRGIRHILWNQAELSAYENQAFKPRFTEEEWARFEEVRRDLQQNIIHTAHDGIFICRVPESSG